MTEGVVVVVVVIPAEAGIQKAAIKVDRHATLMMTEEGLDPWVYARGCQR